MNIELFGVYLIDFKTNIGGELSGKHYAIIVSELIKPENTVVVIPLTSKKRGKKYRGGITIDCKKYQINPTKDKAFARVNKIREISKFRIYGNRIYSLDANDIQKLKESMKKVYKL